MLCSLLWRSFALQASQEAPEVVHLKILRALFGGGFFPFEGRSWGEFTAICARTQDAINRKIDEEDESGGRRKRLHRGIYPLLYSHGTMYGMNIEQCLQLLEEAGTEPLSSEARRQFLQRAGRVIDLYPFPT